MSNQLKEALNTIENAISKSAIQSANFRKRAEDVYEQRIAQLVEEHDCSEAHAHALAGQDEVASQAYMLMSKYQHEETKCSQTLDWARGHFG